MPGTWFHSARQLTIAPHFPWFCAAWFRAILPLFCATTLARTVYAFVLPPDTSHVYDRSRSFRAFTGRVGRSYTLTHTRSAGTVPAAAAPPFFAVSRMRDHTRRVQHAPGRALTHRTGSLLTTNAPSYSFLCAAFRHAAHCRACALFVPTRSHLLRCFVLWLLPPPSVTASHFRSACRYAGLHRLTPLTTPDRLLVATAELPKRARAPRTPRRGHAPRRITTFLTAAHYRGFALYRVPAGSTSPLAGETTPHFSHLPYIPLHGSFCLFAPFAAASLPCHVRIVPYRAVSIRWLPYHALRGTPLDITLPYALAHTTLLLRIFGLVPAHTTQHTGLYAFLGRDVSFSFAAISCCGPSRLRSPRAGYLLPRCSCLFLFCAVLPRTLTLRRAALSPLDLAFGLPVVNGRHADTTNDARFARTTAAHCACLRCRTHAAFLTCHARTERLHAPLHVRHTHCLTAACARRNADARSRAPRLALRTAVKPRAYAGAFSFFCATPFSTPVAVLHGVHALPARSLVYARSTATPLPHRFATRTLRLLRAAHCLSRTYLCRMNADRYAPLSFTVTSAPRRHALRTRLLQTSLAVLFHTLRVLPDDKRGLTCRA